MEQMMKGFEALLAAQNQHKDVRTPSGNGKASSSGHLQASSSGAQAKSLLGPYEGDSQLNASNEGIFRTIKFEFPKFHGGNPRSWIRKCNKLFSHHAVVEL